MLFRSKMELGLIVLIFQMELVMFITQEYLQMVLGVFHLMGMGQVEMKLLGKQTLAIHLMQLVQEMQMPTAMGISSMRYQAGIMLFAPRT